MPETSPRSIASQESAKIQIPDSEKKRIIELIQNGVQDLAIINFFSEKNYDIDTNKLAIIKLEISNSLSTNASNPSQSSEILAKENLTLTSIVNTQINKDGEVVSQLTLGTKTPDPSSPKIDGDTSFAVGSVTKMFTSATLLKLWDEELSKKNQGIISDSNLNFPNGIDTKLSHFMERLKEKNPECRYLNEIEKMPHYQEVSLRDLLNHTHALGSRDDEKLAKLQLDNPDKQFSPQEIVNSSLKDSDPQYGKFKYGNLGAELSAMIIELVTQKTFDKAIEETLLDPLKLSRTEMKSPNSPENFASGYAYITPFTSDGKEYKGEIDYNKSGNAVGAGGIITNAQNGAKFMQAFLADDVNSGSLFTNQEVINSLFRDKDKDQPHVICGVKKFSDGSFGHSGDNGNSEAEFKYDPKTKITSTYMASGENLTRIIATEQLIKEGNTKPDDLQKYYRVQELNKVGYDFKEILKELESGKSMAEIATKSKEKITEARSSPSTSPRNSSALRGPENFPTH